MVLQVIRNKIYEIRGQKVTPARMSSSDGLDFDLVRFYEVEPERLKETVRRNGNLFPGDFIFELSKEEYDSLKYPFATLEKDKVEIQQQKHKRIGFKTGNA